MRIVYMGTPDFAVMPLQTICESGDKELEVVGVVTNPDKPAGRGQKAQFSPVKQYALSQNLPILQPEKFRDPIFLESLAAWKADIQVVVAFKMLPEIVWNMPPLGTVNLHASLLPNYRGAAPIQRALMNGETETGVTTFLLRHQIDTGAILDREKVAITDTMTGGELHDTLMELGSRLLLKSLQKIAAGDIQPIEQSTLGDEATASPAPKIFKEEMRIDWQDTPRLNMNKIRALSPFPTAWTTFVGKGETVIVKIYSARFKSGAGKSFDGTMTSSADALLVPCASGTYEITELQMAGHRRLSAADFLRGFELTNYRIQ